MSTEIRNAKWYERPANPATGRPEWKGYKVRNRGAASAYSREGFFWFDSWGKAVPRPSESIRFHGGPLDGQVVTRTANAPHQARRDSGVALNAVVGNSGGDE